MEFVTAEQMKEWEKGKDHLELMENAGKAIAEELGSLRRKEGFKSVVFVCGPGNNGGDGYTAARYLANAKVFPALETKTEEARINREKLGKNKFVEDFHDFDCMVDCLLGTGIRGELREPVKGLVEEMNRLKERSVFLVSVDVPTGLNTSLEVKADLTICLHAPKKGMEDKNFVVKEI